MTRLPIDQEDQMGCPIYRSDRRVRQIGGHRWHGGSDRRLRQISRGFVINQSDRRVRQIGRVLLSWLFRSPSEADRP